MYIYIYTVYTVLFKASCRQCIFRLILLKDPCRHWVLNPCTLPMGSNTVLLMSYLIQCVHQSLSKLFMCGCVLFRPRPRTLWAARPAAGPTCRACSLTWWWASRTPTPGWATGSSLSASTPRTSLSHQVSSSQHTCCSEQPVAARLGPGTRLTIINQTVPKLLGIFWDSLCVYD